MSEIRDPDRNTDAQYTQIRRTSNKKRRKGMHPLLTMACCAVISTACGLGGGWFAVTHIGNTSTADTPTTITYDTNSTGTSQPTSANISTDGTMTISEVAAKASPTAVEILTETTQTGYGMFGGSYTAQAAGSGVIISTDGYIITNNHVVEDAQSIKVTTYDGKEYDATLVGTDSKSDIAVIKIEADNLIAATIGDSSKIAAGDTAVVIGNPLGTLGGSVTSGIISAPSREIVISGESMELIQTNATINSGNSGGGLYDGNGNLIGIVNAKDSGTTSSGTVIEGIGFAIPVNTAMDVASQLIENGKVTNRATIGIHIQELTRDTQNYKAGLYVSDVIKGGGAEAAGLQAYDRIVSVDGTPISSYTDLSIFLRDKAVGDVINIVVEREGEQLEFRVMLTGSIETTQEG